MPNELQMMALRAVSDWKHPIAQSDLLQLIETKAGVSVGEAWDAVEALFWSDHLDFDSRITPTVFELTDAGRAALEAGEKD